jgi:hypothetical protein
LLIFFCVAYKKKKKQALMEGLEENEASQEADYMAESESEVGEADMEIDIYVCSFCPPMVGLPTLSPPAILYPGLYQ